MTTPGAEAVTIPISRLAHAPTKLPHYATEQAAGMDLCLAGADVTVTPGERILLPTGFRVAIPAGFEGQVRMRSGTALQSGLIVPNAPGTIDADYRGEVKVLVMNVSQKPVRIVSGERIAQLVVSPVVRCQWLEVPELAESGRGEGGFGSTGTH